MMGLPIDTYRMCSIQSAQRHPSAHELPSLFEWKETRDESGKLNFISFVERSADDRHCDHELGRQSQVSQGRVASGDTGFAA